MKRFLGLFLVLTALVFGVCILPGCDRVLRSKSQTNSESARETLHDKVLRAGAIRCSYASYPPYCVKDPSTGQMSGIFVEILEKVGERLGLKIMWTEEVGWGTIIEDIESGRNDMFGAGLWQNSTRGKRLYFSKPLFYNGIRLWVRSDESRFKSLDDINSSAVRLTTQDGAMDDAIAKSDFPKAQRVSIPQLNPWSDNLLNLITGKADISLSEPASVSPFLEKNPGTVKELRIGRPVRVFANCYAFRTGEGEFKAMIDSAIDELASEGEIERVLRKYEKAPGEFLRVAPPYLMPDASE